MDNLEGPDGVRCEVCGGVTWWEAREIESVLKCEDCGYEIPERLVLED